MSLAPPVTQDGFYYNGDIYVEVGNLNRHKRASVAEITAILRPDLKKTKTPQVKDPVGHWYEAQLIHYGLPPSKDKARAKMRLLEALNASKLVVPAGIVALEASLRKQHEAAERKAKAQYKTALSTAVKKNEGSKKRKQLDSTTSNGTTINVNINFGPHGIVPTSAYGNQIVTSSPQQEESLNPKRAKKFGASPPKSKVVGTPAKSITKTPKKEPRAKKEPVVKKEPFIKKEPEFKREANIKKEPVVKKEPSIKKEPEFKREANIKKESAVKKEPSIKKEPEFTQGTMVKNEPAAYLPPLGLINGYYDIECIGLETDYHCHNLSLILCLESPNVWGAYDFGPYKGILHLPSRPFQASEDSLPFYWRGRELPEGRMSFGEIGVGGIGFLGHGNIEGWISLDGNYMFTGTRCDGPMTSPRSALSMRREWEEYNEEQY